MSSIAQQTFEHAIKDADDLLAFFDTQNISPAAAVAAEVLKRASLVMALAALETYIEDRIVEASKAVAGSDDGRLARFYRDSLQVDLKTFHTPSTDRVKAIFVKYLQLDVTEAWIWNNYDSVRARADLNALAKKRGDIAHRSARPIGGQPSAHVVTREDLRKHIRFLKDLVAATDAFLAAKL